MGRTNTVGGTCVSDESLDQTPLPHHRHAWSQHDLLASALAQYVEVHGENGGRWPAWSISPKSDDVHDDLKELNRHLDRLGWMAKLTRNEGWVITVFPTPERQFPRFNTLLIFWGLSALTLTLAGHFWMTSSRPTEGWLHTSSLLDALLGYTLPILGVLIVASFVQQRLAARYGVRCGHILPVPDFTIALYAIGLFPSNWLFWPFGLLLLPTLPRMDARPWPDRASLGFTALAVPVVLSIFGAVLFLSGLRMTPEYLASTVMPLFTEPPVFLSLLALELVGEDAWVRLIWAHPWVHAGGMLMLFAWISILPIPTFPGGRLLIARMGMLEARSSSTQSLIFVIVLFCAYVFGVFEAFSLWFLVFALLLPLLFFFGNDLRIPLILNETTGLREEDHRRMGMLLLVVFVLMLPASQPVVHDDDWNADLTFELQAPEVAVLQEDGSWLSRTMVKITNPSSLRQPYAIHASFAYDEHDWNVEWDCDGEDTRTFNGEGCGADLLPQRTAFFWLNLTWDGTVQPTMATGTYMLEINDGYETVPFSVRPALEVVPSQRWYDDLDGSTVLRCVDLQGALVNSTWLSIEIDATGLDHVQTPLVLMDGSQELKANHTDVPDRVCLSGLDPLVFQPSMATLHLNNDTFTPLLPERRPVTAYVPVSGWTITSDPDFGWGALLAEGGILLANEDQCPLNASLSTPPRPMDGGAWVWDTTVRSSGYLPLVEAEQNLTLLMVDGTNVSLCDDLFSPYPRVAFAVEEGPELLISWMGTSTRFWSTPWAIASNGTLLNTEMATFTITNPSDEPVPFRLTREGSFGDEWQHNWNGTDLPSGATSFSLIPPESPLATMWLSLEAGTVVLHLASYQ
jgi:hypothetical protein